MKNIYIGIDPAFRKKGFCMCIIDGQIIDFITYEYFADFIIWIANNKERDIIFSVENSNLQNITFDMTGSKKVTARKSRNVGTNQAVSQITVDIIEKFGYSCAQYSPMAKGRKITDKEFRFFANNLGVTQIKNYKGNITEQDKRDAFMLCFKTMKKTF
jgi:hypothetical protein